MKMNIRTLKLSFQVFTILNASKVSTKLNIYITTEFGIFMTTEELHTIASLSRVCLKALLCMKYFCIVLFLLVTLLFEARERFLLKLKCSHTHCANVSQGGTINAFLEIEFQSIVITEKKKHFWYVKEGFQYHQRQNPKQAETFF